jgi:hypothetical protein
MLRGPLFDHYTEGAAPDQTILAPAAFAVAKARQHGAVRCYASLTAAIRQILSKKNPPQGRAESISGGDMEETDVNLPVNPNHRNQEIRGIPLIGKVRACGTAFI